MQEFQIQRLKKDQKELENYIHRLHKQGKDALAYKVTRKNEYLNQQIAEMQTIQ